MPPDDVAAEVRGWLRKAESDLRNIALVLPAADCPFDTVCFHAQQAAEKYLKGWLTYLGVPFPKVHDLEELIALLPADERIALAAADAALLSQLGVAPRYPGWDDEIDRSVAERAHAVALTVKTAVLAALAARRFAP